MARWAIGDVQGCCEELAELLALIGFSADRDRLWLVGDLVNRGPRSLQVLRLVRSLGDNVICVLGNHDLHLLAVALADARQRKHDTLDDILAAPDRDALLEWLLHRPLAYFQPEPRSHRPPAPSPDTLRHDLPAEPPDALLGGDLRADVPGDLMVHAGVVPQWNLALTLELAGETEQALRTRPHALLSHMYGDQPDRWRPSLHGAGRLRFAVNVMTRMRFCTREGRIDMKLKGKPDSAHAPWLPWFQAPRRLSRAVRIVFGHWSALGFYRADGLLGLDTGCVWGGRLTAVNLDEPEAAPLSVPSRQPRSIEP